MVMVLVRSFVISMVLWDQTLSKDGRKRILNTGSIQLATYPNVLRLARTIKTMEKVKDRLDRNKMVATHDRLRNMGFPNQMLIKYWKKMLNFMLTRWPSSQNLTKDQKNKRKQFVNWIANNFRKEDMMCILFSDKNMFDLYEIHNCQNPCIWTANRDDAD